ncbi:MAG: GntR family transcriptional regulator [Lachnospiraceae bacterium]|nr:GntR family transcriptional regulator [Lachnospiraceae bacterium]
MSKNSKILYQKIANDLANDISRGMYKPGSPLLKQSEYALSYGVSCGTVKKAFAVLEQNGLIRPVKGHGTYVNAFENNAELDSGSLRGDLLASNQPTVTRVLSQGVAYASQPVALQNIYIRYDRMDNINFYQYDFFETSLFSLYSQYLGTEDFVSEKSPFPSFS